MSDVKYWESTYSKALGQFKDLIVKAEKSKQEVRDSAITDAAKSARRIDGIRRSYNLEVRLIKERMDKHIYQKDKDDKDKEYQALRTRMDDVKSKAMEEKKQLLVGSRPQNAGASEGAAADKTLDQADKIQDMTEKKYENMITIIQDTEEVGGKASRGLIEHREQIGVITEDVMEIEDSLTRAERLIRSFSKRMATDRFIQCFACLNVSALVSIILYIVIDKVGTTSKTSS
eukprot:421962_1